MVVPANNLHAGCLNPNRETSRLSAKDGAKEEAQYALDTEAKTKKGKG
jgi:hypothetical protein